MLMLCVDSSSTAAAAALMKDGELLCEYTQNQMKTQSVKMLPMIEEMLKDVDLSINDVDIFASGIGPGSFTGVRIGVATVRGFVNTLDKRAVSVNSLEILANNVSVFDGKIIALVYARENECYVQVFEKGNSICQPCVMTLDEITEMSKGEKCIFVGDGGEKNREALSCALPDAHFASGRANIISAASLGEVAWQKAIAGDYCGCEGLIPLYLRKSQAEREYDEKHSCDR